MTKFIVNVPLLNVRRRIPAQMPDKEGIAGTVKQNYTFEGREVPEEDAAHLGMDKWYQDTNGQYYWGGGLIENVTSAAAPGTGYAQLLNLSGEIVNNQGNDIVVAILDSGCMPHSALNGKVVAAYDAITDTVSDMVDDDSAIGHGTFIAGLIAGGAIAGAKMTGMAPGVKLIIIKIIKDAESMSISTIVRGLRWLANDCPVKPHVINMSFSCTPGPLEQDINTLIDGFIANGVVIIAAGQDNAAAFDDDQIFYPARRDSVIGVGCINASLIPAATLSSKIKYVSPNIVFNSIGKVDDYVGGKDYIGCSFSTALVSGLFALILSFLNHTDNNSSPVEIVNQLLKNFDPNHFSNTLSLFKNETIV